MHNAPTGDDGGPVCPDGLCSNGGVCLPALVAPGSAPSCLCPPGFAGPDCSTEAAGCGDRPCANGARCVQEDAAAGYSCRCDAAYYNGRNCEVRGILNVLMYIRRPKINCICLQSERDACSFNDVCKNGGECLRQPFGYMCDCAPGFRGRNCETPDTEAGTGTGGAPEVGKNRRCQVVDLP